MALKGVAFTEEHKKKIGLSNSISLKGKLIGKKNPFFGKHHSRKTKEKLRIAHLGKKHSKETKRKISESHKGDKSHFWKGGKSFEPYSVDWTRSLKIAIRERDYYTCQLCGKKQCDRAFPVHHIDYNKLNCNSDNLITLCARCHSKTNANREYWMNYFQKIWRTKY